MAAYLTVHGAVVAITSRALYHLPPAPTMSDGSHECFVPRALPCSLLVLVLYSASASSQCVPARKREIRGETSSSDQIGAKDNGCCSAVVRRPSVELCLCTWIHHGKAGGGQESGRKTYLACVARMRNRPSSPRRAFNGRRGPGVRADSEILFCADQGELGILAGSKCRPSQPSQPSQGRECCPNCRASDSRGLVRVVVATTIAQPSRWRAGGRVGQRKVTLADRQATRAGGCRRMVLQQRSTSVIFFLVVFGTTSGADSANRVSPASPWEKRNRFRHLCATLPRAASQPPSSMAPWHQSMA
jgi:hypothetical protein